ncbi:MAG: hypothetical protein ACRD3N_15950 [Terracidiphilus sp.]
MPEDIASAVAASWKELWKPYGIFELKSTLKARRHVGLAWFRSPGELPLPDTGPVVVLNSEPWGVVTLNLKGATVSQLETIQPVSFAHDPATGEITATVKFHELKYAGSYEARRARATASALKIASKQMSSGSTLAAAADPNDSLTLAKSYQDKLATDGGQNGNTMLNTYYRYNNNYSEAFDNPKFAARWATYPTDNQTTSYYAQQTHTAATPGNTGTVPVNGGGGSSAYNRHAFTMQLFLVAAVSDQEAATAATQFDGVTKNPAQQSQTVDNVLNIVKTSPPPHATALTAAAAVQAEPLWRSQLRNELADHCDEIKKAKDDMARGILLREETGAPIEGQFNSYFSVQTLTLQGKVTAPPDGSAPSVAFTSAQCTFPEVSVRLGAFPGKLHGELTAAVDKARFLKSFLGKRVASTVQSSGLLTSMGRLMTLALAEQAGTSKV